MDQSGMDHNGRLLPPFRLIGVVLVCALLATGGRALAQQPGGGVLEGYVTTQSGTIRLGGAQVVLHNSSNQEVSAVLSDGDGHFRFTALQEGRYTLTASLEGFGVLRAAVVVTPDATTERSLDLPLATLTQTVEVMAPASIVSAADTLGSAESINRHETDEYANGSGLGGALRLLASVIEVPGGVSIKGGRPACRSEPAPSPIRCSASSTSLCPTTPSIRSR